MTQIARAQAMIDLRQFGRPAMERYSVDPGTALLLERDVTGHVSAIQLVGREYQGPDSAWEFIQLAEVNRIVDDLAPGLSTRKPVLIKEVHESSLGMLRVVRRTSGVVLTYEFPLEHDKETMLSASLEVTEPNRAIDSKIRDLTVGLGPPNSRWFLDSSGAAIVAGGLGESVRQVSISMNIPFLKPRTLNGTLNKTLAESFIQRLVPSIGTEKERLNRFQSGALIIEMYLYPGAAVSYYFDGDHLTSISIQLR